MAIRPATHVVRSAIEMMFGMVGGLLAVVISFRFYHQHRLSGFRAVRGPNLAHLIT